MDQELTAAAHELELIGLTCRLGFGCRRGIWRVTDLQNPTNMQMWQVGQSLVQLRRTRESTAVDVRAWQVVAELHPTPLDLEQAATKLREDDPEPPAGLFAAPEVRVNTEVRGWPEVWRARDKRIAFRWRLPGGAWRIHITALITDDGPLLSYDLVALVALTQPESLARVVSQKVVSHERSRLRAASETMSWTDWLHEIAVASVEAKEGQTSNLESAIAQRLAPRPDDRIQNDVELDLVAANADASSPASGSAAISELAARLGGSLTHREAEVLKRVLEAFEAGYSQKDVARELQVSESYVSQVMHKVRRTSHR